MIDFDQYSRNLQNNTNFGKQDNFDQRLSIIKSTTQNLKHNMLMGDAYSLLQDVYANLQDLEMADLIDFAQYENLWMI